MLVEFPRTMIPDNSIVAAPRSNARSIRIEIVIIIGVS